MAERRGEASVVAPGAALLTSIMESLKSLPSEVSMPFSRTPPLHLRRSNHQPKENGHSFMSPSPSHRRRLHEALGGGCSADVLLWRKKHVSVGFLSGATLLWLLFQWLGCSLIPLLSLVSLATMISLFSWSQASALLNRPAPRVPKLEVPDDVVVDVARALVVEINKALSALSHISMGTDIKLFFKVASGLLLLFLFGGWFHFLTLVYIAIIGAHTLPIMYEKHGETIDEYAQKVLEELRRHYQKVDPYVLRKIPQNPTKLKKEK